MLASSRNLAAAEGPKRRAKTPALQSRREWATTDKSQPSARSVGPYAGGRPRRGRRTTAPTSAPTQGAGCRSLLHCPCTLYCRAGVHARRGGLRRGDAVVLCKRRTARPGRLETPRKGIGKVMCRTPQSTDAITGLRYPHHAAHAEACLHSATAAPAPSRCIRRRRRSTPQPLAGEPFGGKPFAKPPMQGEVDAPFGADGGVHCRLAAEISCKIRQDIAPPPQGTMLASSRKPCGAASLKTAGENARPTLRPGTGGDTKAAALCQARRRADASIGPYAGDGPPRSAPRCGDMLP